VTATLWYPPVPLGIVASDSERPERFDLNSESSLFQGMMASYLGHQPWTKTAYDSSAFHNDGTLTNFSWPNTSTSGWKCDSTLRRTGLQFLASGSNYVAIPTVDLGTSYTYSCWTNLSDDSAVIWSGITNNYGQYLNGGRWTFQLSGNNKTTDNTPITNTGLHHWFMVRNVLSYSLYVDGIQLGSTLLYTSGFENVASNLYLIGKWYGGGVYPTGLISDPMFWRGDKTPFLPALADPSNVNLSCGGVDLIKFMRSLYPAAVAGGGGNAYTLTAANGSVSIAQRKLMAAYGSLAITGEAANLTSGRKLTAAYGSTTISGQAASLLKGTKFSAAYGTAAISGEAATFTAQRKLTAAVGTVTITGQSANLTTPGKLSASCGTVAIAGQAASLTVGRKLTASYGSISTTGEAASFVVARLMSLVRGSLTITGEAATLTYSGYTPVIAADIQVKLPRRTLDVTLPRRTLDITLPPR
jgi:hypothetical protein